MSGYVWHLRNAAQFGGLRKEEGKQIEQITRLNAEIAGKANRLLKTATDKSSQRERPTALFDKTALLLATFQPTEFWPFDPMSTELPRENSIWAGLTVHAVADSPIPHVGIDFAPTWEHPISRAFEEAPYMKISVSEGSETGTASVAIASLQYDPSRGGDHRSAYPELYIDYAEGKFNRVLMLFDRKADNKQYTLSLTEQLNFLKRANALLTAGNNAMYTIRIPGRAQF